MSTPPSQTPRATPSSPVRLYGTLVSSMLICSPAVLQGYTTAPENKTRSLHGVHRTNMEHEVYNIDILWLHFISPICSYFIIQFNMFISSESRDTS